MDGVHDALHEVLEREVRLELVRELEDPLEHLGAALEPLVHGLHLSPQVAVLEREREVVRETTDSSWSVWGVTSEASSDSATRTPAMRAGVWSGRNTW